MRFVDQVYDLSLELKDRYNAHIEICRKIQENKCNTELQRTDPGTKTQ